MINLELREKLRKRKNKIGLVGTDLDVNETSGSEVSASISHDFRKIEINFGESIDLVPDLETRVFAGKAGIKDAILKVGEDLVEHETGHRENHVGTRLGCPFTTEMHDIIKEGIYKGLKEKGKQAQASYVTNAFEDILDNINCRRNTDFGGQTLFWNNQGLVHNQGKTYSPFYDTFVRLNLMFGSEARSYSLLRRFFSDSSKVSKAINGVLSHFKRKLSLEHTVRMHERPEFSRLFNQDLDEREKLWSDLAYNFAVQTADLLQDEQEEKMFGSSEADDENSEGHNPFDREINSPQIAQKIAIKRYAEGKGPALHRDVQSQLYDLYRGISKSILVKTTSYSESQSMPLVHFGKRFVTENDQKIRFRGIGMQSDGTFGIKTTRHSIDFPVAYKVHPMQFPKLKVALMDRSGSMRLNPDNETNDDGNPENIGSTSFIPWGDRSKYHFALKGYFGVDNYLESQGIADYVQSCALGFSGETAKKGDYRKVAKSLLTMPSGGTSLDISGLERELDQHSLVLSISDGEVSVDEDERKRFEKKLKECDFAHIQIGNETEFSSYLRNLGVPVYLVRGDEDLSKTMINFVSGYYSQFKQPQNSGERK